MTVLLAAESGSPGLVRSALPFITAIVVFGIAFMILRAKGVAEDHRRGSTIASARSSGRSNPPRRLASRRTPRSPSTKESLATARQ